MHSLDLRVLSLGGFEACVEGVRDCDDEGPDGEADREAGGRGQSLEHLHWGSSCVPDHIPRAARRDGPKNGSGRVVFSQIEFPGVTAREAFGELQMRSCDAVPDNPARSWRSREKTVNGQNSRAKFAGES